MSAILEPPSWPGGPPICEMANLPAFKTEADAAKFHEVNCPHGVVLAQWCCKFCGCWHYWGGAPTDSNGQCVAGGDQLPKSINELIWKTKVPHEANSL